MSHLSRDERLLALEGALHAARQAHTSRAACRCRTEVDALAPRRGAGSAVDVPEPSPLFWDHLAARVGDAIAREPAPSPDRRLVARRVGLGRAAVVHRGGGADICTRLFRRRTIVVATAACRGGPSARRRVPSADESRGRRRLGLIAASPTRSPTRRRRRGPLAPLVGQSELSVSALGAERRRWRASWRRSWRRAGT